MPPGGKIAFIPGETPLVVCDRNAWLTVWEANTAKLLPQSIVGTTMPGGMPTGFPMQGPLAFAPASDAKIVAVNKFIGNNGPVLIWDPRTGKVLLETAVLGSILAISRSGHLLALDTSDGVAWLMAKRARKSRLAGTVGFSRRLFAGRPDASRG